MKSILNFINWNTIVFPFQKEEFLIQIKKNLFKYLNSNYGWYKEIAPKDLPYFFEKLKKYWVKIKNLNFVIDLWKKINWWFPFYAISIGPYIDIWKDYQESTAVHETLHVMQYSENAPIQRLVNDLKIILWFIYFWIFQQRKSIKKMKNERIKYWNHTAILYATKNTPFEFEAFFNEWESSYLEKRQPLGYKQYETKKGRSESVKQRIDQEILERIEYIKSFLDILETKKNLSIDDREKINFLIEDFLQETKKILEIKEIYWNWDWEIISAFLTPQWPIMRLESEINKNKRFEVLDILLEKEKLFLNSIKQQKNIKLCSKIEDIKENWIILLQAKDKNNEKLYDELKNNKEILQLSPNIEIKDIPTKQWNQSYIKITFTKIEKSSW